MEEEKIKEILVYNINEKDKIVGLLKDILKGETLKNIRNKIKKMNDMHVFIKYINNEKINIIDKDIEEDFTIESILINDKETYKIFFQEQYIYQMGKIMENVFKNYTYQLKNIIELNEYQLLSQLKYFSDISNQFAKNFSFIKHYSKNLNNYY